MAEFTITITVPNDKVDDLKAAFGWVYGGRVEGTTPATPAAIRAQFKDAIARRMRTVYRQHKIWLGNQDVPDTDLGET